MGGGICGVAVAALLAAAPAAAREPQPDVIYVPTPYEVVDEMLRLANVKKGDVLYDLGSGDGRIPVTAAKRFGIRAVGIDIDPVRIREAKENAKKNGAGKRKLRGGSYRDPASELALGTNREEFPDRTDGRTGFRLAAGTTYSYRVRASQGAATSSYSNTATATTSAASTTPPVSTMSGPCSM